jgi:hypothetical protein
MGDPDYEECLRGIMQRRNLRKEDVNLCARVLYHELSKHAHGNTEELLLHYKEHTTTEVAAIEAIFCALKKKGFFRLAMRIVDE